MIRVLAAIAIVVGLAPHARAQTTTSDVTVYRVKQGDTLDLLAAEFYGDRGQAIFIIASNKILHPRPLKAGEKIRIPVTRLVTTSPGETWESIASTYLGDPRRGRSSPSSTASPPTISPSGHAAADSVHDHAHRGRQRDDRRHRARVLR